MPRSRIRRSALGFAVVLALGGVATLAYLRWATILGWFDSERVNQAALDELNGAKLASAGTADPTSGWPQWRGPNRDGVAPAGAINPDWTEGRPHRLWAVPCGHGYSSLAVVGGRVYGHDFR